MLMAGLLAACASHGAGTLPAPMGNASGVSKKSAVASSTTTLSFVAHEDDDLLFMNPDIASDVQAGYNVWVVYLTAGDDPAHYSPSMTYAGDRISGDRAAYALAANVPNTWTYIPMTFAGHEVATNQLNGTNVHLIFTFVHAAGSDPSTGQSDPCGDLDRMLHNPAFVAYPIDGRPSYTSASFKAMLVSILQAVQPSYVRTQDTDGYNNSLEGDHIDHVSAAIFASAADTDSAGNTLINRYEYLGYAIKHMASNIPAAWANVKTNVWEQYRPLDDALAGNPGAWTTPGVDNVMNQQYDTLHLSGTQWIAPSSFVNYASCSDAGPLQI